MAIAGTAIPPARLHPRWLISRLEMTSSSTTTGPWASPFVRWVGPTSSSLRRFSHSHVLRAKRAGDADKVIDELLKKYGKVVYTNYDTRKPTSPPSRSPSTDDDSESLSFAMALANVANDVKAEDIRVLYVKPLVYWTQFFIIVTAFSNPQINAIGSKMRDIGEKQFNKVATGDAKPNAWTLLDFGDVVVHIFLPQQRTFYNLEEFYGNATPIDLPFDTSSKSSYRNS
ncbi:Ribosomal silencing factor RsfS [Rhynchospora pubera]|uniref:Protein Iojap, chloroplastic n=1 Tax=Rhynchospora pubera TaxID=906938 RepID=A0AAV8G1M9_9POAL|nr:Ribosomal silencing factor RsfS [Rhynchospora pubera]